MAASLTLPKAYPATENLPPGAVPLPTAAPPPYQAMAATAPSPPILSPHQARHPHLSQPQVIIGTLLWHVISNYFNLTLTTFFSAPQIVVSQSIPLGRFHQLLQCPNCMATVTTSTRRQLGCPGWIAVIVLLVVW